MSGLVHELQRAALDPTRGITDLLRLALVVARKLGVSEFQRWVELELGGYNHRNDDEIPGYRLMHGNPMVMNPYHGWQPLNFADPGLARNLCERKNDQAISEIEHIASTHRSGDTKAGVLIMRFPPEVKADLMASMNIPMEPALHLNPAEVHGILDKVRNTVLDWSMQLEEQGISGEGMSFSTDEIARAASAGSPLTVVMNQTNIGTMTQSQIQQGSNKSPMSIQTEGDTERLIELVGRLRDLFAAHNIEGDDGQQLRAELATLEAQAKSPRPNLGVMKSVTASMGRITEGALGNVVGAKIVEVLARITGLMP